MISLEVVDQRLRAIAERAAAGDFAQAETRAKVLAEDVGRASRPVYPSFKGGRAGQTTNWDANHQRYAAALPHVRAVSVRAAHQDAAGVAESVGKARAALGPMPQAEAGEPQEAAEPPQEDAK